MKHFYISWQIRVLYAFFEASDGNKNKDNQIIMLQKTFSSNNSIIQEVWILWAAGRIMETLSS